jgi:Fe-S oxidoreductase/FAD/FMN-containing dehydrogenase
VHSVVAGRTADNVEELEVLTYDGLRLRVGPTSERDLEQIIAVGGRRGEIYRRLRDLRDRYAGLIRSRYPRIPRRVSGYNLDELLPENGFHVARALVGTESTCVTVLDATVRLIDSPPARSLLLLGYPDVYAAADDVTEVLAARPFGLEGIDDVLVEHMRRKHFHPDELALLPDGRGWLLVEFGGDTKEESDARARQLMDRLTGRPQPPAMKLYDDPEAERKLWQVREAGLGATANVPGESLTWEGWEDAAVPPERLGSYLRAFRGLLDRHGYACALYGHFGDGCIHTRIDFELTTAEGITRFRSFVEEAADLVVAHGGSLSGEHGDGQSRAELLPKMFGDELVGAMREFKSIWDPDGMMNPGRIVEPDRLDENLRLGVDYGPPRARTHFSFPDDHGSFARATLRCVGIGTCRRSSGGTMCPSYMVTREEQHTTRGRARLLFEMLQGQTVAGGWRDGHVKEALDLCLACKGCKHDCPVQVDMATYKAEFLSHYYGRRLRPRAAYAMGLIRWWARAASHAPMLVNAAGQAPGLSSLLKKAAGVAPQRRLPRFARQTFTEWFASRPAPNLGGDRVVVWPDTFTNHFRPEAGRAAVEVLEAGGYGVVVPRASLCCGRPLYDYGMLRLAKRLLRRVLAELDADIRTGIPVVCLEPSCTAVFRDELPNLFPLDEQARRLARQTFHLTEFVERDPDRFPFRPVPARALVHGHCHHKAVLRWEAEPRVLDLLGLEYEVPDSGCCGMAGSFGFEAEHYEVSQRCGERVLLPAVRQADASTVIVADGFSCQTQIEQATGRRALHVAEVLRMGLQATGGG